MIRGFIFDLDGVLTDTAEFHFLAWKRLADELGLVFTRENNELLKGVSRTRSFEIMLELNNAADRYDAAEKEQLANLKNEYYKELVETITPDMVLPGILPLLERAAKEGIRLAVASISKNAPRVMELLGIAERFDYIADAALVKNPKPDPEIFATCVSALGLTPEECIGFEDAQAGIESIKGAGVFAVGINVTVTSLAPDYAVASTEELDFEKILAVRK